VNRCAGRAPRGNNSLEPRHGKTSPQAMGCSGHDRRCSGPKIGMPLNKALEELGLETRTKERRFREEASPAARRPGAELTVFETRQ
jgi:hypothetical protein